MEQVSINQQMLKFKKARETLLLIIAFTAVNLVLSVMDANLYLLFSAIVPQIILDIGKEIDATVIFFVIAFCCIGVYFLCWFFANIKRVLMPIAFVLFIIDTLILVSLTLPFGIFVDYILDFIFHVWVLYYLYHGTVSWKKLKGISETEFKERLQNITITEGKILSELEEVDKKENS